MKTTDLRHARHAKPGYSRFLLGCAAVLSLALSAGSILAETPWPEGVKDIRFMSPGDNTEQPAMFLSAKKEGPAQPLVIFLHQWSADYRNASGATVARWCLARNWNFLQPDFRGPNKRPQAMGSDLVLADMAAVIEYAKANGNVDPTRIFLLGASGGGHASLLTAARMPGVFRAVSAWVPITDLVAWHGQRKGTKIAQYAKDIEAGCGGAPVPGSPAEAQAKKRSPLSHLAPGTGTIFDINAGIHDGHNNLSVPISHSFHAYNVLAEAKARVPDAIIEAMTREEKVPAGEEFQGTDAAYGANAVLFRRESPNVRLTIFEGGHQLVYPAAFDWLEKMAAMPPGVPKS